MIIWEVKYCNAWDTIKVNGILSTGWEPFSVDGNTMWFRRRIKTEHTTKNSHIGKN